MERRDQQHLTLNRVMASEGVCPLPRTETRTLPGVRSVERQRQRRRTECRDNVEERKGIGIQKEGPQDHGQRGGARGGGG